MALVPDDNAIVLRFPPGGADQIKKMRDEARWVNRRHNRERTESEWEPRYRLSVFADSPADGEQPVDTVRRLISVAGLHGIRIADERNNFCWTSTAGAIRSLNVGVTFVKDGFPGEAKEHYSLDLGPSEPNRELIETLVGVFVGARRGEGVAT